MASDAEKVIMNQRLRAKLINRYSAAVAKAAYGGSASTGPAGGLILYAGEKHIKCGRGQKCMWMPHLGCKTAWYSETWREISSNTQGATHSGTGWNQIKRCVYDIMDAIKEKRRISGNRFGISARRNPRIFMEGVDGNEGSNMILDTSRVSPGRG